MEQGEVIVTVCRTGSTAASLSGEAIHMRREVGTAMRTSNLVIDPRTNIDPNFVYNGVSFASSDPSAKQGSTSVIKTVTNSQGEQTKIYQNYGGDDAILLEEVTVTSSQ